MSRNRFLIFLFLQRIYLGMRAAAYKGAHFTVQLFVLHSFGLGVTSGPRGFLGVYPQGKRGVNIRNSATLHKSNPSWNVIVTNLNFYNFWIGPTPGPLQGQCWNLTFFHKGDPGWFQIKKLLLTHFWLGITPWPRGVPGVYPQSKRSWTPGSGSDPKKGGFRQIYLLPGFSSCWVVSYLFGIGMTKATKCWERNFEFGPPARENWGGRCVWAGLRKFFWNFHFFHKRDPCWN